MEQWSGWKASSLSGGQRQILSMAFGLAARPSLLLIDEPSLGLSPQATSSLFQSVRAIARTGTAILLVEQDAFAALAISTRGYVLERGRVVLAGASSDLTPNDSVRKAYLGL